MSEDDKPGYKNPPKERQFRKGQSGNPKGRPKKKPARQLSAEASFARAILNEASDKISITVKGRTKKIPRIEAILRRLSNDALNGDRKASDQFIRLLRGAQEQARIDPSIMYPDDYNPADDMPDDPVKAAEFYRQFMLGHR